MRDIQKIIANIVAKEPRVSTKVYDTRLEAKTAFKQLCNELAQEYTKI